MKDLPVSQNYFTVLEKNCMKCDSHNHKTMSYTASAGNTYCLYPMITIYSYHYTSLQI